MLFNDLTANQSILLVENICYGLAILLLLLAGRIWLHYRFQALAISRFAREVRRVRCARLAGGPETRPQIQLGLARDLRLIFDLTRWRYPDFYPQQPEVNRSENC